MLKLALVALQSGLVMLIALIVGTMGLPALVIFPFYFWKYASSWYQHFSMNCQALFDSAACVRLQSYSPCKTCLRAIVAPAFMRVHVD